MVFKLFFIGVAIAIMTSVDEVNAAVNCGIKCYRQFLIFLNLMVFINGLSKISTFDFLMVVFEGHVGKKNLEY